MEQYKPLIEKTIKTIINQFHRKPYNFFNEHEFHQYCYHVFYSKKEFSKQFTTSDGKKTNILHPEYPTVKRFDRKKIEFFEKDVKKGVRARYDMAILNPSFIQNNPINTIINRNINFSSGKENDLIAAFEFKFITNHDKKFQHEIDYDFNKLSNAQEVNLKYMLVFANTIKNEVDYFAKIKDTKGINIVYVVVYEENNKKRRTFIFSSHSLFSGATISSLFYTND